MKLAGALGARAPQRMRRLLYAIDPLPLRRTLRSYTADAFRRDARTAVNGALVAFPQGVACAMIAGLPITHGLFASAVAGIIGPIFARSRFIVLGPTNSTAVLLLSAFLAIGAHTAERVLLVPLLLLMVGVLQIVAAYLNVGSLVAYISRSVTVGYIAAAAMLIVANQVQNLIGVDVPDAPTLLGIVVQTALVAPRVDWPTAAVSVLTALLYLGFARFTPRLPRIALTLAAAVGLGLAAGQLDIQLAMLPTVEATNWSASWPVLNFTQINQLASAALAIAFVGVLEASSIGKSLAARAGERLDTNQEVFAMGMANLACAFSRGMPASGSPTRSMVNFTGGAATPLASVFCGLLTLVLVFGLGQFVGYIPRASLGVIVVFVAISLINVRQIRFVVRSTPTDAVVFIATAGAALMFPLDSAIFIGTATSIVLFLRKAGEPELVEYAFNPEGHLAEVRAGERRPLPEISIVHVEGSLFFGAAELLQEQIRRAIEDPNLRILILRLKYAHHLDASAVLALEELVQFMRENGRGLIVSGARKDVTRICKRTGLLDLIGRENFFPEWPQNPTLSTRNALKRAQQILGQKEAAISVFGETRMKPVDEKPAPNTETSDTPASGGST